MNSPKATKDDQQNDRKLGQKHNQRSGAGLSQTGPRLLLLIVVVKTILPKLILSPRSVICFVSSISQNERYRKITSS